MVLFKRKPVQYLSPPRIEDDETEVWVISQTEEIFVDYEAYLNRMEFYKQSRFICQITGHSGLTFFEALKSELAGAKEVEEAFPEALKGPILRRVQFQTISRIDNLVDMIFEEFKQDYYPGEQVMVHVVTGERLTGVVRERTIFSQKHLANGDIIPRFSRYFVSLDNRPGEEAVVDDSHITRDRKIFTKQVLRSFIKKTVTREAWTGAPWLVRPEICAAYHIETRVPPQLRHETKLALKKENQAARKTAPPPEYGGMVTNFPAKNLQELRPKSQKSKQTQQQLKQQKLSFLNPSIPAPNEQPQYLPGPAPQVQGFSPNGVQYAGQQPQYHHGYQHPIYGFPQHPQHQQIQQPPPQPPPPPPIKYPIEDLEVPTREGALPRPSLKYFSKDTPVEIEDNPAKGSGILMESVGPLLETWDTLNVYCEIFKLDSFTFDDFVDAMQFSYEDIDCELFVEIHCAALKLLVSSEQEGGKLMIQLPEMDSESDEEDSSANDDSALHSPTPEPEPKPTKRTTRSSLAKQEAEALKAGSAKEPTPEPTTLHRAAEITVEYDWVDKLKRRDFKDGGWQVIVIGLLHQLSKNPRHEKACNELLTKLAPVDMDASQETAKSQYASLDINLRVKVLQILCMLTVETKAIRGFMEEGSETMTGYRKQKIQWQRDRKVALEELRLLNEERKILLPANTLPSPEPESKTNGDSKTNGAATTDIEENEDENMDSDEDVRPIRSLRGGVDRNAERQRKREQEEERKAKAKLEASAPKQSKQFLKLLKDIAKKQDAVARCEDEIAIIDNDLREADCPRTRVLGKDRFWNRYYWFERNGMPYGGLPDSSTADSGYANARIWVQGPDQLEREGYIDMKDEWQNEYKAKFGMTVPERKEIDEGNTHVFTAHQWGYIDDSKDVDALIDWLDPRGLNELKLQKELKIYRAKIVEHMDARKDYLFPEDKSRAEDIEDEEDRRPRKRASTRKQADRYAASSNTVHRCLNWHNTLAIHSNGHLHSEQPRVRKQTKKERERDDKSVKDEPAPKKKGKKEVAFEERETRSESKAKDKKGR